MIVTRSVLEDGRIMPRCGDLARVIEDVVLEGGACLRLNQNVLVQHVAGGGASVGVKWRDEDGTHVMALPSDMIEVVL